MNRPSIAIISLMLFMVACKDDGPTQPGSWAKAFVNFNRSLQGDSLIVYIDSNRVWKGRVDTSLVHGTSGLLLFANLGPRVLSVNIPSRLVRASVYFSATPDYDAVIAVHFNDAQKAITFRVDYFVRA